jgi:hypothetical protein
MKNLILYLILLATLLYSAFGSASNLSSASAIAFIRVPEDTDLQTAIYQIGNGGVIEIAHGTYSSPQVDLSSAIWARASPYKRQPGQRSSWTVEAAVKF